MLNKNLWILWFQGFESCPQIVKSCVKSWENHNSGWKINLLDETNINKFLQDEDMLEGVNLNVLSYAHRADIIRLLLLKKYGGVWADATTYCTESLDQWLPKYANSDFFAFSNPGPDRKISNWFLYSEKEGGMINKLIDDVTNYWRNTQRNRFKFYTIETIINRRPSLWFSYLLSNILRKMPYFWFHYLFAERLNKDNNFAQCWAKNIKFNADFPHRAQFYGLAKPTSDINSAIYIDKRRCPVYKLSWKMDTSDFDDKALWWFFVRGEV